MGNMAFNKEELTLPFNEWVLLSRGRTSDLNKDVYAWYKEWELYDLFNSPMKDEQRRYIRLGHYCGWFDKKSRE